MPRQPRLDAPGDLRPVLVRGIERRPIVRDTADRAAFLAPLEALATAGSLPVDAWGLLPAPAHLLVRTGQLVQTRYTAIGVQEARHLLDLVRSLPLHPGRAGRALRVARAREGVASLWCRLPGQSGRALAAALGQSHQAVDATATRGEHRAARWQALQKQLQKLPTSPFMAAQASA